MLSQVDGNVMLFRFLQTKKASSGISVIWVSSILIELRFSHLLNAVPKDLIFEPDSNFTVVSLSLSNALFSIWVTLAGISTDLSDVPENAA